MLSLSLLAAAPGFSQEISVFQNDDRPLVDGGGERGDGAVFFDLAAVGSAGFEATLTITNDGNSDLTGIQVNVTGDNSGDYTLDLTGMDTTVAPAASTTFKVTFSPAAAGDRSADLQISSNDADENPFDILLRGRAIVQPPQILVVDQADRDQNGNTSPGDLNIHEAVELANSHEDENTILFHDSLDGVSQGTTAQRGEMRIFRPVIIQGNGARNTILTGNGEAGIFSIQDREQGASITVRLRDLTLRDARQTHNGGAVYNGEDLIVERCSFIDNQASGSEHPTGGAIFTYDGQLTITDSTFANNVTTGKGGAIFVGGNGILEASNSTFDSNEAAEGGAIYIEQTGSLEHCAVTANSASMDLGGGGIAIQHSGNMLISGSIIAGNTANGVASDLVGSSFSGTFNLIGDSATAGGFTDGEDGNIVGNGGTGILPLATIVEDLANNGGQTDTRALASGSPAINAGSNAVTLPRDQRGYADRISDTTVDMGPFEVGASPATPQEIEVQQPIGNDLTDGNTTVTFPLSTVSGSHVLTFSIKNEGGADLSGLSITKSGADQDDFIIDTGGMQTTLRDLDRTSFSVTFSPGSPGTKTASIAIVSNDADENPFDIDLGGTAVSTPPAVLKVDKGGDVSDLDFSPGELTLREAIQLANLQPDTNTISFDAGLPGTPIGLTEPLDVISQPATIIGNGAATTIIDAQGNGRVFDLGAVEVSLSGMSLRNGLSPESENGGAIRGEGTALTIQGCEIADSATQGTGGEGAPFGGGIYLTGSLLMENSTVANNTSTQIGGGVLCIGDATFRNCTISGNSAAAGNGGVGTAGGTTTFLNCTIVENTSTNDSSFGGLLNFGGTLRLDNTIVAGNTEGGQDVDVVSIQEDNNNNRIPVNATGRNNLIGNADSAAGFTNGSRNIVGDGGAGTLLLSTVLDPLQNNGGETRTHALTSTSPALNKGNNNTISILANRDQRNFSRVVDGKVDVGAFEFGAEPQGPIVPVLTLKTLKNNLIPEGSTVGFENLFPGNTATQTFKVVNEGDALLSFTSASGSSDFTVSGEGSSMAKGGSVEIAVSFSPATEGEKSATITLSDNVGGEFTFEVSGRAVAQSISRTVDRDVASPLEFTATPANYDPIDNGEAQVGTYYGLIRTDLPGNDIVTLAGYGKGKITHNRRTGQGVASVMMVYEKVRYSVKGTFDENGVFTSNFTKKDEARTEMTATGQLANDDNGVKILDISLSGDANTTRFHLVKTPTSDTGASHRRTVYIPAVLPGNSNEPGGDGIGFATLGRLGAWKAVFRLGDGTKGTTVMYENAESQLLFYQPIYPRAIAGWFGGVVERDLASDSIEGFVHWVKGEDTSGKQKLYPGGFDLQRNMTLDRYRIPSSRAGERVLSNLTDEPSNAVVNFFGGNTPAVDGKLLTWDSRNRIKHLSNTRDESLTLAIATKTGLVTGKYRNSEAGQNLRFSGIALQDQGFVAGHFIGDGESGRILIDSTGQPDLRVESALTSNVLIDEDTLDFGSIGVDGGISEIGIRIRNAGTGTLRLNNVNAHTDSGFAVFQLSGVGGIVIPPDGGTILRLLFDPDGEQAFTGGLEFETNDPTQGQFSLNLIGTGVAGSHSTGREEIANPDSLTATPDDVTSIPASNASNYDPGKFPGNYYGLMVDQSGADIGYISVKVTNSRLDEGVVSGKIQIRIDNLFTFKIRGSFDGGGAFSGTLQGKRREQFGDLTMNLHLTDPDGDPQIVGSLDGIHFVAGLSPWHSRRAPFPDDGRYSILIPHNDDLESGYPGGAGAGTMTVSAAGSARMLTFLADGTKLSWSGKASASSQLQVYRENRYGRISSLLTFRPVASISDLDGEFSWERYENLKSRYYPYGFQTARTLIGSKYEKPAGGKLVLSPLDDVPEDLTGVTLLSGFGVDEQLPIAWSARNRIIYSPERVERLVTGLSTTTGIVTGYWWDRGTTNQRYRFRGVVFQKQQVVAGYWYYKDGDTGLYQIEVFVP